MSARVARGGAQPGKGPMHAPDPPEQDRAEPRDVGRATDPAPPRRFGWWRQGTRLARYRLVIPVLRSRHPPEHTARGVMVGLLWAMTPLVGIQMMLVVATWIVCQRLFSWHFSLVLGLAWTWVTNAFTILPFYYAYYVTGQILLGHWDSLTAFDTFAGLWNETFSADVGFWQALGAYTMDLIKGWGVPLMVGSVPWALVTAFVGYRLSLKVSRRRAEMRDRRRDGADQRRLRWPRPGASAD